MPPPLSLATLRELQEEFHADDVALTENMRCWTEAEARAHFESGGTASPPLRLLCLHGGGANATVMRHQIRHLQRALGGAVCECVDGGREWPLERVPQIIQQMFGQGPYYGWYGVVDDGDPARNFVDRVSDASVAFGGSGRTTYTARDEKTGFAIGGRGRRGSTGASPTVLAPAMHRAIR